MVTGKGQGDEGQFRKSEVKAWEVGGAEVEVTGKNFLYCVKHGRDTLTMEITNTAENRLKRINDTDTWPEHRDLTVTVCWFLESWEADAPSAVVVDCIS